MENIDTDPIYKILCMAAVLLIPLLPSILLYKIAPKEKFFSRGNFSGFKINATGASAIYIILFVAFYAKVDFILLNIDKYTVLQQKFQTMPWRVDCDVTLMLDAKRAIDLSNYEKYINSDLITSIPSSPTCNFKKNQTISFYVDNDNIELDNHKISGSLVMNNGFGTVAIDTMHATWNLDNRTIKMNAKIMKQSTANYSNQPLK